MDIKINEVSRQLLGEMYNKWLSDNKRKDGNYSNTVFDFLFDKTSEDNNKQFFEDGLGEHQYFVEKP